jgi:hypothetical protein
MRRVTTALSMFGLLLLAGCSGTQQATLKDQLENPLFAERYAESLVDRLVELEIVKDPSLENPATKEKLDSERQLWLQIARDARQAQRGGAQGDMLSMNEYAKGDVLYAADKLHFGTLFEVDPLPSLHVYLTTVVDPRDAAFPDATAMDIGLLKSAYGSQTYDVPHVDNPLLYRTVVLWDTTFGRLHSFAQLSK